MSDFSKWREQATPDEVSVSVCFNRRLLREFTEATERLEQAERPGMLDQPAEVEELANRVVELHEQVRADEAEHTFVFVTVPYDVWKGAVDSHPPTDEQRNRNPYLDHNPDTFPPVAVRIACREPDLSEADVEWLRSILPRGEFYRLFEGAYKANEDGSSIPFSVSGIVARLGSELSSITPVNGESPSRSSVAAS